VALGLGEVVVAVDALGLHDPGAGPLAHARRDAVHHLLAVEQGEVLCPPQLGEVGVELGGALDEVGQVGVGELDPPALRELAGDRDVALRDPVADAPRAGVQEQPDPVRLVGGDLDEVVAGTQRPELQRPVRDGRRRVEARGGRLGREDVDAPLGGGGQSVVAPTGRQRHGPLEGRAQHGAVEAVEVADRELRADGDHAAADVDAHGGGHERPERGDDGADGGALAQVGVGNQGEVGVDEGQGRGAARLLEGVLLQQRRPRDETAGELVHARNRRRAAAPRTTGFEAEGVTATTLSAPPATVRDRLDVVAEVGRGQRPAPALRARRLDSGDASDDDVHSQVCAT